MPPGPAVPPVSVLIILYALLLLSSVVVAWTWAIVRLALGQAVIPRFRPRVVPWRGPLVLVIGLLWLAVQTLGPVVYLKLINPPVGRAGGGASSFQPSDMMIASALENVGLLVVLPLLLVLFGRARRGDFLGEGKGWRWWLGLIQGAAAWPLIAPVVYGAMLIAVAIWGKGTHPLERAIQTEGLGRHAWVFFLASVVLAPMAEELVFRGAILGWLTRRILGRAASRMAVADHSAVGMLGSAEQISGPTAERSILLGEAGEIDVAVRVIAPERSDFASSNEYAPPLASLSHPGQVSLESPGASALDPERLAQVAWRSVAGRLLAANLLVSILFAGLHFAVWPTPVPIFFLSLMLGLLYQRTGSLVPPIALHMTFNGVSTVLMFLALGAAPAAPSPPKTTTPPSNGPVRSAPPPPTSPNPLPRPAGPIPVDEPAPTPGAVARPRS